MAEVQVEEQGVVVTERPLAGQCRHGPTIRSYYRMPQHMQTYCIYSRNSRTFLIKILYLNLGCVIYARKRFYVNKSGYTGNFLNIVLKA